MSKMCTTPENTDTVATLEFTGQDIHKAASAIFATIGSVMILSGFFGNWLLIAVVFKQYQRKPCAHSLFIVNLALADMLTLAYWFTFFVLDLILGYHPIVDSAHCVVNGVIICTLCVVSITSLVSVSLNRYLHVCYSHLYSRIFTPPRTICCCVVTWLLGVILALPPAWNIAGSYRYNPSGHICAFSWEERISYPKITGILFTTVPMMFVGYWNYSIFRFWKQARKSLTNRYPMIRKEEKRKRKLIAKWVGGLKKKSREPGETETKDNARLKPAQFEKEVELSDLRVKEISCASGKSDSETTLSSDTLSRKKTARLSEVPEGDSENILHTFGHSAKNDEGSAEGFDGATIHSRLSAGQCTEEHVEKYQETTEIGAGYNGFDQKSDDTNSGRRLKSELERVPEDVPKRPPEKAREGTLKDMSASPTSMLSEPSSPISKYSRRRNFAHPTSGCRHLGPAIQSLQRQHRKKKAREVALVRSLFVVSILMFICSIPFAVINFINSSVENLPSEAEIAGNMLLFFNNSINWIVYGVMNPVFRKGYAKYMRRVLTTCCRVGRERAQMFLNASLSSLTTASSQRTNTENDPKA